MKVKKKKKKHAQIPVLYLHSHLYCLGTINLPQHSPLHFSHESINCSRLLSCNNDSQCLYCNRGEQAPYSHRTPREMRNQSRRGRKEGGGDDTGQQGSGLERFIFLHNYDVVEINFALRRILISDSSRNEVKVIRDCINYIHEQRNLVNCDKHHQSFWRNLMQIRSLENNCVCVCVGVTTLYMGSPWFCDDSHFSHGKPNMLVCFNWIINIISHSIFSPPCY